MNKMKLELEPFDDFWLDCYTTIRFTLLLSNDSVDKAVIYNNNYEYTLHLDDTMPDNNFYSIIPIFNVQNINEKLLLNPIKIKMSEENDIVNKIISFLNQKKIILLGIDMYYWIPESLHWGKNHITHNALVYGYDEEKEIFHVMDAGDYGYDKFEIGYENLVAAANAFKEETYIYDKGNDFEGIMYNRDDIVNNAKRIMDSINKYKDLESIWRIKDSDGLYFGDIVSTHIFGFENRQKANKLLFQIAFRFNDECNKLNLMKEFEYLELEYDKLKNKIRKLCINNKIYGRIDEIRNKIRELLNREYCAWEYFVNDEQYEFIK